MGTVLFGIWVCVVMFLDKSWAEGKQQAQNSQRISGNPARVAMATAPSTIMPGQHLKIFSGTSHCLVNGMAMFEGAVWSPVPCSICFCERGRVTCNSIPCRTTDPQDPLVPAQKVKIPGEVAKQTSKPEEAKAKTRRKMYKNGKLLQVISSPKPDTTKKSQDAKTKRQEATSTQGKEVGKQEMGKKPETGKIQEGKGVRPAPEKRKGSSRGMTDAKRALDRSTVTQEVRLGSRRRLVDLDDIDDNFDEVYDKLDDWFLGRPLPGDPWHPSTRTSIMESLPIGCLLSDTTIACSNSRMTHVPILKDPGIKILYLAENAISKIPARAFAGLPNLEWLDLSKNKLNDSSLHPDLFRNLTKLKRLNLDGNRITKIPQLPASLEELKMNDNKINDLTPQSFKGASRLLTLELEGNDLHDGNVSPLAFRPLKKLIYLRLDENRFRTIPPGLPASLQELHMDENHIEEIQEGVLNKTLNLKVLVLSNNYIQENRIAPRAWIHLPLLETIDLSSNKLVHVPSFLPIGLRQLILHHNQIERIPGYVFAHMRPGLEFLHLSHNHLQDDGIHGVSFLGLYRSLTELLLDNNHLRAIPRGLLNLKSLQVLRLNDNYIRYVPLNSICDTRVSEDSLLISVHLENNLIDRRLIPPTAFSCIKTYHSIVLRPQSYED
uniref:Si:dkey-6n6.1 n=1 Tax=Lepisosteus oculatus TaxID=7918 RepID=W5NEP3_LEPOC|nr:PREDICTED: extracellular matrix protein 2-like [Lepisosteus oculatus]